MMRISLCCLAAALAGAAAAAGAGGGAPPVAGCPAFPATSVWDPPEATLPVAADSAQLIASIGLDSPLHPDIGTGLNDG